MLSSISGHLAIRQHGEIRLRAFQQGSISQMADGHHPGDGLSDRLQGFQVPRCHR